MAVAVINRVKNLPVTEADTLALIRGYLKLKGFFVVRMQAGIGVHKGIPDLYFIGNDCRGECVQGWVETKAPKGKLTSRQIEFRDEIAGRGGHFIEAHSLNDVLSYLRDHNMIREVK